MTTRACLLILVLTFAVPAVAAEKYADGWNDEAMREAIGACTEELVEGAWNNTKREQGADPAQKLTPEIRKQLEPQIAGFRKLCDCTVKGTAKKYGRKAYQADPNAVGRYAQELVKKGTCKLPQ